jgi:hypothetical protein
MPRRGKMEVTIRLLTGKEIKLTQEELNELFVQPRQNYCFCTFPWSQYQYHVPYYPGGLWYYQV